MTRIQKCRYGLALAVFIIVMSITNFRYKPIKCALCQEHLYFVSMVEWHFGHWQEIPSIHPVCQDYIATYAAPNCGMTMTEWLETRGYYDVEMNKVDMSKLRVLEENE